VHDRGQPLSLEQVLEQQVSCAESILEALRQERDALSSGDPYLLNLVGANKAQLVEELEAFEIERQHLSGGPAAEAGYRQGAAGAHWSRLLDLIEQCRDYNQRNGALVTARRSQILQALEVLRGTDTGRVYDASGSAAATAGSHSLGAA
jgi:flagellar biosynthesis/type III secretory pathway chaperone